jgi:hypothetical protein
MFPQYLIANGRIGDKIEKERQGVFFKFRFQFRVKGRRNIFLALRRMLTPFGSEETEPPDHVSH